MNSRRFSLVHSWQGSGAVLRLRLLLLLNSRLRLVNYWRGHLRFLLFRKPQPTLRNVEHDGAVPFKGD